MPSEAIMRSHDPFITDLGRSPVLESPDGAKLRLGRYGVWKWDGRKHQVVDQGDDLAELQRKHGIAGPPIELRGKRRNGIWDVAGSPRRQRNGLIRAYHATNRDFDGFHPYSHFGTAAAASDRAESLRSFSVDVVGRDPGSFRTIPVLLDIQNPLRMPDLADVDSDTGLSMKEAWQRFFDKNDLDQETWDELSDDEREEFIDVAPRPRGWESDEAVGPTLLEMGVIDMDEFEEKGRRNEGAFELLAEKGYDGIVYGNVVEDPGTDSWINFQADQVRPAIGGSRLRNGGMEPMTGQELFDVVSAHWKAGDLRRPEEIIGPRPQARHPQWVWDVLTWTMESYGFPREVERLLRKVAHTCHLDHPDFNR